MQCRYRAHDVAAAARQPALALLGRADAPYIAGGSFNTAVCRQPLLLLLLPILLLLPMLRLLMQRAGSTKAPSTVGGWVCAIAHKRHSNAIAIAIGAGGEVDKPTTPVPRRLCETQQHVTSQTPTMLLRVTLTSP